MHNTETTGKTRESPTEFPFAKYTESPALHVLHQEVNTPFVMKTPTAQTPKIRSLVHKAKAGFSLIELLVVIAVIGIIAAIAIPTIANLTDSAKTAKTNRNAQSVASTFSAAKAAGAPVTGATDLASAVDLVAGPTAEGHTMTVGTATFYVPLTATEVTAVKGATTVLSWDDTAKNIIYTAPASQ